MTPGVAWIFPGQGAQTVGMGREFYEQEPEARAIFDEASQMLGYDLADLCFHGPKHRLDLTEYTQPALLTVSVVALRMLERAGVRPVAVAGHSLGEYTAVVAAGGLAFREALLLVRNRGRYMQQAVEEGRGLVCAILGLERAEVVALCAEASALGVVSPANYNAPGQIVIAGEKSAVEEAMRLAKAKGCRKVVTLPVSVPVHTALMQPAADRLAPEIAEAPLRDLAVPLVNNADAKPIQSAFDVRQSLIRQLASSVLWEDSMRALQGLGVGRMIELGPGTVLSGLAKRIVPDVSVLNVHTPASLAATVQALSA